MTEPLYPRVERIPDPALPIDIDLGRGPSFYSEDSARILHARLGAVLGAPAPAPDEAARLRTALEEIVAWKMPRSDYGRDYGSNGERDYIRSIARAALAGKPEGPAGEEGRDG